MGWGVAREAARPSLVRRLLSRREMSSPFNFGLCEFLVFRSFASQVLVVIHPLTPLSATSQEPLAYLDAALKGERRAVPHTCHTAVGRRGLGTVRNSSGGNSIFSSPNLPPPFRRPSPRSTPKSTPALPRSCSQGAAGSTFERGPIIQSTSSEKRRSPCCYRFGARRARSVARRTGEGAPLGESAARLLCGDNVAMTGDARLTTRYQQPTLGKATSLMHEASDLSERPNHSLRQPACAASSSTAAQLRVDCLSLEDFN